MLWLILRTDGNGARVETTKSVRNLLQSSRQMMMEAGNVVETAEVILKVETRGFSEWMDVWYYLGWI